MKTTFELQLTRITIGLLLLAISASGFANTKPQLPIADSTRIYELGNQAFSLRNSKPDSSILLAELALSLSAKYDHLKSQVSLLRIKALAHQSKKEYSDALNASKQSLALAQQIDYRVHTIHNTVANIYYVLENFDEALFHYEQALEFAASKKDTIGQIDAFHNLGSVSTRSSNYEVAIDYYLHSLELQRAAKFEKIEMTTLRHIGWIHFRNNQLTQGLAYYNEGIQMAKTRENFSELAMLHMYLASSFKEKGILDKSLENYQKAVALKEHLSQMAILHINITLGLLDDSEDDFEKVFAYNRKRLQIAKQGGDEIGQAKFYSFLGYSFERVDQLDSAIYYQRKSLKISEKLNLKSWVFEPLHGLGRCYEKLNKIDSAFHYLNRAKNVDVSSNKSKHKVQLMISLGKAYDKKQNYLEAVDYLYSALQKSEEFGLLKEASEACLHLHKMFEKQGDIDNELLYLKKYQIYHDSLIGKERVKQMAILKARDEFEMERQLLVQQNKTNQYAYDLKIERQKSWIILVSTALGLTLIGLFLILKYQQIRRRNSIEKERLQADIKNEQFLREKQQREKLQAMDQFKSKLFTDIAHELRTPLSIIKGMNKKIKNDPEVWLEKGSNMVEKNTQDLLNLANQILLLQSLESDETQVHYIQGDILQLLKNLFLHFEYHADNKGIHMHFESEDESFMMDYDSEKIRLIVSNLLSNAIKFTPEYGRISMRISQENKNFIIQVSDTGIGIPKADQHKVFQRFFQTKNEYNPSGSGVGLALVKEVVNVLNGEVQVESEVNKGTVFTVKLPKTNQAAIEEKDPDDRDVIVAPQTTQKGVDLYLGNVPIEMDNRPYLLIVEDNADMRLLLQANFSQDFQLYLARDGKEGIDMATEKIPDLIISDVMMPGIDGYELCQQLKKDERTNHIPIILLTAKADQASKIDGLKTGADAFLSKPFDEAELLVRVSMLLEVRNTLQKRYADIVLTSDAGFSAKKDIPTNTFLKRVQNFIHTNMENENFELDDLCNHLYLSRSQVFRKVKALTGHSPIQLIRKIRLNHARELLMSTELSVSEIANRVGFASSSYFSNSFFKEYNERPSAILKVRSLR